MTTAVLHKVRVSGNKNVRWGTTPTQGTRHQARYEYGYDMRQVQEYEVRGVSIYMLMSHLGREAREILRFEGQSMLLVGLRKYKCTSKLHLANYSMEVPVLYLVHSYRTNNPTWYVLHTLDIVSYQVYEASFCLCPHNVDSLLCVWYHMYIAQHTYSSSSSPRRACLLLYVVYT